MKKTAVRFLFLVSAGYDGMLGMFFLFAGGRMFEWFRVPPPNHFGYVQFPAAILIVFGIMFMAVAINPLGNRNLIPYGMLLKASYCGVVFYHWFTTGVPYMWKPFAICDLMFLALFVWAYGALRKPYQKTQRAAG